ncbi:MAG: MMPL family transporter [Chitinophagaceae bacterium]|nr:MMPL family transporter [Chitinophagaceae bacterium]
MWQRSGKFVLKYRLILLVIFFSATAVMGFLASKVTLSYDFAKAIPTDNPKYKAYQAFKKQFGDDGNLLVIGIKTPRLFDRDVFNAYALLHRQLKTIGNVEDVLSVPYAVSLTKDTVAEKFIASRLFPDSVSSRSELDSSRAAFLNLPFYRGLLYNPETQAWLMGVRINKDTLNSPARTKVIDAISTAVDEFGRQTQVETHISGLPLIRTRVADRIQQEMKFFLIGSLLISALILLLFFRSMSTMLLSLLVVLSGVIWSVGIMQLCGYKITLLNALTPSLVVVIGVPNCIYFINKYHTSLLQQGDKIKALIDMVSKMGVVTLFCNITAAIGFAVFALTKSAILKEFGVVAGISIMVIFFISFILLPSILSYLKVPQAKQFKYLENKWITGFLVTAERWVLHHKKFIYAITGSVLALSIAGIFQLKAKSFIVDDLPKKDKIYTDLKFFESNFKGVMPLEIVVDTKKRRGLSGAKALAVYERIDSLAAYISAQPEMNRPLSIAEGLKFAKQSFYDGDSAQYALPNSFDMPFVGGYLKADNGDSGKKNNLSKMLSGFMDTARQRTRISVSMADIGTEKLPMLLEGLQKRADQLFDTARYSVQLTGTSITFLEGNRFIVNGLRESILWAFLLIAACMLYLFRSFRILVCSLVPNLIPLVITAGIMGWVGIPLKPSTVLVFSVALGIAIDITIRFLVNYKQELPTHKNSVLLTVSATIKNTGLSIVYTSLVLIAGFVIFCGSSFGGTISLGWLTSVTLFTATLTNLLLLPVLLLLFAPGGQSKKGVLPATEIE